MDNSNDKVFLNVQLSRHLRQRASIMAAKQGISRSELVRRAIKEYVDRAKAAGEGSRDG